MSYRLVNVILLVSTITLSLAAGQTAEAPRPLPMAEVEACQIAFTNSPMARDGRWGGQLAIYDAESDDSGKLVSLSRQIIEGREHLPKLVRLDQFEACVRKWRFDGGGVLMIRLLGGTVFGRFWIIDVMQNSRAFRLRLPVAFPKQ